MTKKLNIVTITNELEESAFFPTKSRPAAVPPPQLVIPEPKPLTVYKPATPAKPLLPERANARTLERPNGKRIISRKSFEIYEDQMISLRNLSLQQKMAGELGSMSHMVREAIDDYLQKRFPEQ